MSSGPVQLFSGPKFLFSSAASYDIRFTGNLTDFYDGTNWFDLDAVDITDVISGSLRPVESGKLVSFEISRSRFNESTVYYLAMKSYDASYKASELSNPVQLSTIFEANEPDEESGLSGGAIAGIVIGCLLFVLIIVVAGFLLKKRMK